MASTVPHGILYPTEADLVKSSATPSALADDFRDVASSANSAITAAEGRAIAHADALVNTSHLALDSDGTPYFKPGSESLRVFADTDGNPYFTNPA